MANTFPRIRIEDGSTVDINAQPFVQMPSWLYVRDEDGNEILFGPQPLTSIRETFEARLAPGDLAKMQLGAFVP